jgi:hypothetical protein
MFLWTSPNLARKWFVGELKLVASKIETPGITPSLCGIEYMDHFGQHPTK